jgi:hypothetical protein
MVERAYKSIIRRHAASLQKKMSDYSNLECDNFRTTKCKDKLPWPLSITKSIELGGNTLPLSNYQLSAIVICDVKCRHIL